MTANTILSVDISRGLVEVEGDQSFVSRVYDDFREHLLQFGSREAEVEEKQPEQSASTGDIDLRSKRRQKAHKNRQRASGTSTESKERAPAYSPARDKSLDTSKLPAFYKQWEPKTHAEKVLLFVKFMADELSIAPCTADQIYTCYLDLKEKMPEAFLQAIRDAGRSTNGFVDYRSPTDIRTTIRGDNHFNHGGMKRSAPE